MTQVSAATVRKSGRNIVTKALVVQEYKRRLKDNIKSLNDNFINIISVAKVVTFFFLYQFLRLYFRKLHVVVNRTLYIIRVKELIK